MRKKRDMIHIKSAKEIDLLRKSGKLAAHILREAANFAKEGVTTDEINSLVHKLTVDAGAYPSPLNYHGYPKSVCTSVNEVVTHGIPGDYVLKNGDIVNIDVTCNLNGYHGDTSKIVIIGEADPDVVELVNVTKRCLMEGIKAVEVGGYISDIGSAIHDIADDYGYGVVRDYCGHGIGRNFHEEPLVLHYRTSRRGPRISEGMVFTIEPMINQGSHETVLLDDGWTVVTRDGGISAQFEHTLAVTSDGVEILTDDPEY